MKLSPRLFKVINSLTLSEGIRVLEIGCGTGAAAREIAHRIGNDHILAIDRSKTAIEKAVKTSQQEIENGRLIFRHVAIEDFELQKHEQPFDVAFAVWVGALDGRHPEIEKMAIDKISKALKKNSKLFIFKENSVEERVLNQ